MSIFHAETRFILHDHEAAEWQLSRKKGSYVALYLELEDLNKSFAFLCDALKLTVHAAQAESKFNSNVFAYDSEMMFICGENNVLEGWVHQDRAEEVNAIVSKFKTAASSSKVKWFFKDPSGRITSSDLNLEGSNPLNEFYPWMHQDIDSFAKAFLKSKANVMLLLGPPGTGKTSFIRRLIRAMNFETWITYDPDVQQSESFFMRFAKPTAEDRYGDDSDDTSPRLLVMEDADTMLEARGDGNKLMTRILNLADGLVSLPDRKIIFSTNLPGLTSIDDALLRPGRCFAAIRFRHLTKAEASVACQAIGREYTGTSDKVTLAEAINGDDHNQLGVMKIGFT